jgi:farnesyl-diphosphate farnesyltransferase
VIENVQSVHIVRTADFDALLGQTSRTFALAVPLLPDPLRRQVGLAYLLFRTADTLEDADRWPVDDRVAALRELARGPHPRADAERLARRWTADPPVAHAGCLALLDAYPALTAALGDLPGDTGDRIWAHCRRTACGMVEFLRHADGGVRLTDLGQLRRYCYTVAGIVGEMLTDLFVAGVPALAPVRPVLDRLAPPFGEALQLVNIVKDARADAAERRFYLPPGLEARRVIELARTGLASARLYVDTLRAHGAPRGVVGFTALPVLLARLALDRVETHGPGARVPRPEVARLTGILHEALVTGGPIWPAAGDE